MKELAHPGFEAWDFGEDKIYLSLSEVSGGGKIMIIGTGEDQSLNISQWKITANNSTDRNNYRHVKWKVASPDSVEFESYPIKPSQFPASTLNNLTVYEKIGTGELWAIREDSNGDILTFFKKPGVFDHWAVAEVNRALASVSRRMSRKVQAGYTEIAKQVYWDADKRIVCHANGTEI